MRLLTHLVHFLPQFVLLCDGCYKIKSNAISSECLTQCPDIFSLLSLIFSETFRRLPFSLNFLLVSKFHFHTRMQILPMLWTCTWRFRQRWLLNFVYFLQDWRAKVFLIFTSFSVLSIHAPKYLNLSTFLMFSLLTDFKTVSCSWFKLLSSVLSAFRCKPIFAGLSWTRCKKSCACTMSSVLCHQHSPDR